MKSIDTANGGGCGAWFYFFDNTMSQLTQLPIDGLRREVGPCCSFEPGSVYLVHLLALVFTCPYPSSRDGHKSLGTRTRRFRRDLQAIVDPKINTRRVTKGSTAGIVLDPSHWESRDSSSQHPHGFQDKAWATPQFASAECSPTRIALTYTR